MPKFTVSALKKCLADQKAIMECWHVSSCGGDAMVHAPHACVSVAGGQSAGLDAGLQGLYGRQAPGTRPAVILDVRFWRLLISEQG